MSKKYNLTISFAQSSGGKPDGTTVISDESDDLVVHLTKTKVFTKHLTAAADAIAQELCDMGLAGLK